MTLIKFAYVGEFTSERMRVGVGELTGYRHIRFSKLQIILSYFSNALAIEQGKRSFQISGKLSSFSILYSVPHSKD